MGESLLQGRGARLFLREYWQKNPLVERATPLAADAALDRKALIELAGHDEIESRLIIRQGKAWGVRYGPFRKSVFARLPARNWTLLVNGVENFVASARALQTQLDFVPYARHDDVMVSYAVPGGGVGPHFDSYDVFLLQAMGRRRWQVSRQKDLTLKTGAPLKLLRRFRPQHTWTLASGDVLYLPPEHAHCGVAIDECITWSIGLRAPSQSEVVGSFLDYLHDHVLPTGIYGDAGLMPQRHPAAISAPMVRQVKDMLKAIRWSDADIAQYLGCYLTGPRRHLVFQPGRLDRSRFATASARRGVRLDLKTRMLTYGSKVFINGAAVAVDTASRPSLQRLADHRRLSARLALNPQTRSLLFRWYRSGYITLG